VEQLFEERASPAGLIDGIPWRCSRGEEESVRTEMPHFFISYRRSDQEGQYLAHMIFRELRQRYGAESTFLDVDSRSPGLSFPAKVERALRVTDVVLVIIGPLWLQQFFHDQGVEEVEVYQGTQDERPMVEVTTNSEAAVFRALVVSAKALLRIRDRHPKVSAMELLLTTPSRERAGQFVLTPQMAAEVVSRNIEVSSFFLNNVQF
jgi:hypothetical protein